MFSAFGDSLHSSAISCMAYGKWAHTLARLQASRGCFLVTTETCIFSHLLHLQLLMALTPRSGLRGSTASTCLLLPSRN